MHRFTHPVGWRPVNGHKLTQVAGSMGPTLPSGQVVAIGRCGADVGKLVAVGRCGADVGMAVVGPSQGKMGGKHFLGLSYGFAHGLSPFPLPKDLHEVENPREQL